MLSSVLRIKDTRQATVYRRVQVTLVSPPGRPHARLLPISRPIQQRHVAEAQEVSGGSQPPSSQLRPEALS